MDIKKLGFIIITNETFAFNLVEEVVEKLSILDVNRAIIKLLPKVDETTLIKHYREHLINWNGKEGKSQVPSLGWPAVRNRFSSSVVLILLEGNKQSLSDEILQIKGNTYPERCRQNQIRIKGFNPTYNLMHSSDSAEEALKEAELYFSKKELESFFCGEIGITFEEILNFILELDSIQKGGIRSNSDLEN
ncbi:TPA: nucleoside-diphosphate kinase, partial [Streptococcus pneumoniae]|nr:nucleoside-diphosphate kinase [Streptococcus pneumoniae]